MLGQLRALFMAFCLIWPLFGLWPLTGGPDRWALPLAVAATALIEAWVYIGYRRQCFPGWSWLVEGAAMAVVLDASRYGSTVAFLFMWVNLRALYGGARQKLVGGIVVVAVLAAGIPEYDRSLGYVTPLACTALMLLSANHVLANIASGRDRAASRTSAVAAAGARLAAATNRTEAIHATLNAALGLGEEIQGAVMLTVKDPILRVVGYAGRVGPEAEGLYIDVAELPPRARAAMSVGGYTRLLGADADAATAALGLGPATKVTLAPLAVRGVVFGLLVLAFDKHPAEDLSAVVTTLADEAALTLDQLLLRSRLSIIVESVTDALLLTSETGVIRLVNPGAEAMLGCVSAELIGRDLRSLLHPADLAAVLPAATGQPRPATRRCRIRGREDAEWTDVEMSVERVTEHDGSESLVVNARDVSERERLELELRHAQKLESVGRLAAGIAHEINTPIQFVGDNVRFLRDAFADLHRLYDAYRDLAATVRPDTDPPQAFHDVDRLAKDVDIEFVLEEVPEAIAQTLDGISRVANIVRAMKAFGHPGGEEKTQADLNEAITNTVVVANNEIKYVADVELNLTELPPAHCHLGDINQVLLNLIVNAAHAIGSADRGRGRITVTTCVEGGYAVIEIADTGTGISEDIAGKVFDQFFTTKEVGTGTGQGLALARSLVVDRHNGSIDFTTTVGVGTVFRVRLPLTTAPTS